LERWRKSEYAVAGWNVLQRAVGAMHKLLEELATQRGKTLDLISEIDANPEIITMGGRVVLKGADARKILDTLRELCAANLDLMALLSKQFIN
jgi:hypothetical protein